MAKPLRGKTALVTGASGGIGQAIAQRLAADGALVAMHYNTGAAQAADLVRAIEHAGGDAFTVQARFGDAGDIDTLFTGLQRGLQAWDAAGLDILVNNAAQGAFGPLDQVTANNFDHLIAVNARTPLLITQRALPLLRDGGRIINISSVIARVPMPIGIAYAMTKAAIETLSRALALVAGRRGITVNAVAPGVTHTDMTNALLDNPKVREGIAASTALGRIGQPADIADAVAFLASHDARWVTGQVLDASGGLWSVPPLGGG
jgi:3-oxoacyl-[acyl-carrier protein] reductase